MNKKTVQANILAGIDFELFSVAEVAAILRVGTSVIYVLISSGKLEASKVGRSWRISRSSIQNYIASLNGN